MSAHLLRRHAPITEVGWAQVDDEARERLTPGLAARRLVDFGGPHGWTYSAANLGETTSIGAAPRDGVDARVRVVLPVVELRASFTVGLEALRNADRGAPDVDLDDLARAAEEVVCSENIAIFHGWPEAGVEGIAAATPHPTLELDGPGSYPSVVARAVELLLRSGVGGPYGLALGREEYTRVVESTEHGGYPLRDHLRKILGGPLVWAPGVDGAVVVSMRGGDYLMECGQDLSVGYTGQDAEQVSLYIEESFSFQVATPEAAVAIGSGG